MKIPDYPLYPFKPWNCNQRTGPTRARYHPRTLLSVFGDIFSLAWPAARAEGSSAEQRATHPDYLITITVANRSGRRSLIGQALKNPSPGTSSLSRLAVMGLRGASSAPFSTSRSIIGPGRNKHSAIGGHATPPICIHHQKFRILSPVANATDSSGAVLLDGFVTSVNLFSRWNPSTARHKKKL